MCQCVDFDDQLTPAQRLFGEKADNDLERRQATTFTFAHHHSVEGFGKTGRLIRGFDYFFVYGAQLKENSADSFCCIDY